MKYNSIYRTEAERVSKRQKTKDRIVWCKVLLILGFLAPERKLVMIVVKARYVSKLDYPSCY